LSPTPREPAPTAGWFRALTVFYGTTSEGGIGLGTVFKITASGALTTLYSFGGSLASLTAANGANPLTTLIQATDGNFYGTTSSSTFDGGTVFKITAGGTLTTLYSFAFGVETGYGGLVQANDGNFYGTTFSGGVYGYGIVFKITAGGALTTLYTFAPGANGYHPYAGLIQAADGNLYGTTSAGGNFGRGTVFKITTGGTLTTLYSFSGPDGESPVAGVVQGIDGNFYGTTLFGGTNEAGGTNSFGTIFELTPGGALTTLHRFSGADGQQPVAGLVQGADGTLYGTTLAGGTNDLGTVFSLQLPAISPQAPVITLVQNAEGGASSIAPNTWVTLKGSNLAPAGDSRIWQASDFVNNQLPSQLDGVSVKLNGENAYVYYISPTQINILTPPDMATGTVQVQAATNAGSSASFAAQAQAESPSFFIFAGGPYVAATHGNGSLLGPSSLYPGQSTPANPGETIVLYANGLGPTSTPVVSGSETQSGSLNPLPVVTIGVNPATVQFAGLISPGLYQFNVVVPASTPAGDNALTATYNNLATQSGVLVTVGP
jgi:uncharacterized protein (TIGR03437 family)